MPSHGPVACSTADEERKDKKFKVCGIQWQLDNLEQVGAPTVPAGSPALSPCPLTFKLREFLTNSTYKTYAYSLSTQSYLKL